MATERLRRRIEHLLNEAEEAISQHDWEVVRGHAQAVLALDPANPDGIALIEAAERAVGSTDQSPQSTVTPATSSVVAPPVAEPTSFANGRYQVKRFLGEGGKKRSTWPTTASWTGRWHFDPKVFGATVTQKRAWINGMIMVLLTPAVLLTGPSLAETKTLGNPGEETPYVIQDPFDQLPLGFEANQGQADDEVEYLSRGMGYSVFLTQTEAVLVHSELTMLHDRQGEPPTPPTAKEVKHTVLHLQLLELDTRAITPPQVTGLDELPGKSNYFIGNNRPWQTNVPRYAGVLYSNVYPGVDLTYHGRQRQLEIEFIVGLGADPGRLRLGFEGSSFQRFTVGPSGNLKLMFSTGYEAIVNAPIIFQEIDGVRQEIPGSFVTKGSRTIGFLIETYDAKSPLFIHFSIYLGGGGSHVVNDIATDGEGNVYLVGETCLVDFSTIRNQTICDPSDGDVTDHVDAFVTKFSPAGGSLVYSTLIGGAGDDTGLRIAIDVGGNAYVTGQTDSGNFPLGTEGYARTRSIYRGAGTTFLTKLDQAGALVYSSRLPGDGGRSITVDAAGSSYVTSGSLLSKVTPQGDLLLYSLDVGFLINASAVDSDGTAYVAGVNGGAPCRGRTCIASVLGVNPDGESAYFSSQFNVEGVARGIAVGPAGKVYVVGDTRSCDLHVTELAIQNKCGRFDRFDFQEESDSADIFVAKLDIPFRRTIYLTYLGGDGEDFGNDIAVDLAGNAYVTGGTETPFLSKRTSPPTDFPTSNPWQAENAGRFDLFLAKLGPDGSTLHYSTLLGGEGDEVGTSVAIDAIGIAYVTGFTESHDFPLNKPPESSDDAPSRGIGIFVAKFAPATDLAITSIGAPRTVIAGGEMSYDLTVTTNGPRDATEVVVTVNLPVGTTLVSATAAQGDCADSGSIIKCYLGSLANGAVVTIKIETTIDLSTVGVITNGASVTSAEADPNELDNTLTWETVVTAPLMPTPPPTITLVPPPTKTLTPVPSRTPSPTGALVLSTATFAEAITTPTPEPPATLPPKPGPTPTAEPVPTPTAEPVPTPTNINLLPTVTPTVAIARLLDEQATPTLQQARTPTPEAAGGACSAQAGRVKAVDGGWIMLALGLVGLVLVAQKNRMD